jgi:hypothetical protein
MKYLVTITKRGTMQIEANSEEEALSIAEDMESEGAFEMGVDIDIEQVEPLTCDTPIFIGIHHERPDGTIVRSYGVTRSNSVAWYDNEGTYGRASHAEYATWKPRPDLADFPNARDPLLPYVFDLYWDIKYLSELKRTLENEWFFDLQDLKAVVERHPEVEQMLNTKK